MPKKLKRQELLEFFEPLFAKWEDQLLKLKGDAVKKYIDDEFNPAENAVGWCLDDLKKFLNDLGGE